MIPVIEAVRYLAEGTDNTGTIITASGTVLAGVSVVLVTYFVRRTDRVARATRQNFEDQQYTLRLVSVLRDDYWALVDWAYFARFAFNQLRERFNTGADPIEFLPTLPSPQHRILEQRHAQGEPLEDEEK